MAERRITAFASAARTATPAVFNGIADDDVKGMIVTVDVTAISATPSVVFTVSRIDQLSGKISTLLVSAAITATGTTVLRIHPSIVAVANLAASDLVPSNWRITPVHGDADSITYTVGVELVS